MDSGHAADEHNAMAERFFSMDYEEQALLRDGSSVLLRQIRPEDKVLLLRGFELLSEHSRYLRFLVPKLTLSDEELRYLTEVDGESHFAIGAVRLSQAGEAGIPREAGEGLGVARLIRYPDEPNVAEAAIAVVDAVHGQGLGTLLFMRLVAAGCERGITRFRCEVHASNSAMKDLIGSVNPDYSLEVRAGVMSIEFALPPTTPAESPAEPPRESPLYRFFKLAARGPTEWATAALSLLRRPPGS
jgi:GNAT superfamily N-acetyltransferase